MSYGSRIWYQFQSGIRKQSNPWSFYYDASVDVFHKKENVMRWRYRRAEENYANKWRIYFYLHTKFFAITFMSTLTRIGCTGLNTSTAFFPRCVLYMTLNNLMVRFQWCWSLGECGVVLRCHRSQAHSGSDW